MLPVITVRLHSPFLYTVSEHPELTEFLIPVKAKNSCRNCWFYNKITDSCKELGYLNCLDVREAGLWAKFEVSNIFSFEKMSE